MVLSLSKSLCYFVCGILLKQISVLFCVWYSPLANLCFILCVVLSLANLCFILCVVFYLSKSLFYGKGWGVFCFKSIKTKIMLLSFLKQEAHRPSRSREYHRLYTDFLSEGLIFVHQQPNHRIYENQPWYGKAAS